MTMQALMAEVESLADRYGEQVLEKLLALAPLVAGSGNAWKFAVSALEQGEDGLLVVHVPGLRPAFDYVRRSSIRRTALAVLRSASA
jgi:hypothetical protein